ncbi:vanin-like protein 1 [Culicoides brevitarsis]|uniref:vanin-like protein 1 n=1 Tax=Culicoides brevitarsis TaxID=469753 RepID=UPI00307B3AF5
MKFLSIFFVVSFVTSSLQISTPDSPSYVAAVVEYHKISSDADPVQLSANVNDFLRIIREPDVENADIIVFSETSLNSPDTAIYLPDPNDAIVPCGNNSYNFTDIIRKLSCAAMTEQKYVVINVNEKSDCPDKQQVEWHDPRPCDASKVNIYNTNVVFDRKGTVIAKYRKFNLFGEGKTLKPFKPEAVTFKTDFDVTFGMFICFDLMFHQPPLDLVKSGVQDFIFSANWFSEIPFLSAVQIQQSWAYSNKVNLLAAGRNLPKVGSTGSGIYHGRFGPLTAIMSSKNETKILVATVPKIVNNASAVPPVAVPIVPNTPAAMTNLRLKRDQIDKYVTELIKIPKDVNGTANISLVTDICHNTFCCNFDFNGTVAQTTPGSVSYSYRYAAYSGWRTFDGFADGAVKLCAVIACLDESVASCGKTFGAGEKIEDKLEFTYIKVDTVFKGSEIHMMPNTLDTTMLPLNPREFNYTEVWEFDNDPESEKVVSLELLSPHKDLLTFALWARDYNAKKEEGGNGGNGTEGGNGGNGTDENNGNEHGGSNGKANAVTGTIFFTLLAVLGAFFMCN